MSNTAGSRRKATCPVPCSPFRSSAKNRSPTPPRPKRRREVRSGDRRLRRGPRVGVREYRESREALQRQPVRNVVARPRCSSPTAPRRKREEGCRNADAHRGSKRSRAQGGGHKRPAWHRRRGGQEGRRNPAPRARRVTTAEYRPAEQHHHTHGPGCGHASVLHADHVDYLHDGHVHREHPAPDGVHYDECTTCQCPNCSDSCAICVCADCTCPSCNHNTCQCADCADACNNCACSDCTCPTCTHAV